MNVQHTERGTKWLVVKLAKPVIKALAVLRPLSSNNSVLVSIFAYWGLTQWFYFSSFGVNALLYDISLDSYSGCIYYFINALFPCFSIGIIYTACLFDIKSPSRLQKFTTFVLGLLVLDNVAMGIDSVRGFGHWIGLYKIDLFIQGDPEWVMPIGASDWVLIGICLVCLISYLRGSDFV